MAARLRPLLRPTKRRVGPAPYSSFPRGASLAPKWEPRVLRAQRLATAAANAWMAALWELKTVVPPESGSRDSQPSLKALDQRGDGTPHAPAPGSWKKIVGTDGQELGRSQGAERSRTRSFPGAKPESRYEIECSSPLIVGLPGRPPAPLPSPRSRGSPAPLMFLERKGCRVAPHPLVLEGQPWMILKLQGNRPGIVCAAHGTVGFRARRMAKSGCRRDPGAEVGGWR